MYSVYNHWFLVGILPDTYRSYLKASGSTTSVENVETKDNLYNVGTNVPNIWLSGPYNNFNIAIV